MIKSKITKSRWQELDSETAFKELKPIIDDLRDFRKVMKNGGGNYGLGIPVFIRCVGRNLITLAEQMERVRERYEIVDDE